MIVIMVCHNNFKYTKDAVNSIFKSVDNKDGVKLVLVDNASDDGVTWEYMQELRKDNPAFIEIRQNTRNEWFTIANGEIIKEFPGEDIYLLNNDVLVMDGWLSGRAALKDWGAIGATNVLNEDRRAVLFAGGREDFAGHKVMWSWKEEGMPDIHEESWLTGCSMMINREAYDKVGGLDYSLLHYCQDSDISLRLKAAGYKVGVSKGMRVVHFGGATTHQQMQSGNQAIGQQGALDQMNFAKKHKVQCGQFDFRDKNIGYDKILSDDVIFLKNQKVSAEECEKICAAFDLVGKKVLEIGCAYGEIIRCMREKGIDAIGYEREPAGVEKNKEFVFQRDLTKMWAEDKEAGLYDFVFSRAVLEHIPAESIKQLIGQIKYVLKPGGLTNHDIDTNQGTDTTHINIQSIDAWKVLFADGFELVDCKHIHNGVFNATWRKI